MFFKYIKHTAQKRVIRAHFESFRLDPSCSFAAVSVRAACRVLHPVLWYFAFYFYGWSLQDHIKISILKKNEGNKNSGSCCSFAESI